MITHTSVILLLRHCFCQRQFPQDPRYRGLGGVIAPPPDLNPIPIRWVVDYSHNTSKPGWSYGEHSKLLSQGSAVRAPLLAVFINLTEFSLVWEQVWFSHTKLPYLGHSEFNTGKNFLHISMLLKHTVTTFLLPFQIFRPSYGLATILPSIAQDPNRCAQSWLEINKIVSKTLK